MSLRDEIDKLINSERERVAAEFPELKNIHGIWVVDTVAWETADYTNFRPVWPESLRGYLV